jgi:hypothetical protein
MKKFASILVCTASLAAAPAFAAPHPETEGQLVLTGAHVCVGPACIGTDEDSRWRHHHEGYGYDRDHGCRDITVHRRSPDGDSVTKHERRCD